MRIPTVMIETDNGPVMINKSEYDPAIHKLMDENATSEPQPPSDPAEPVNPATSEPQDGNSQPVATDAAAPVNPAAGEPDKPAAILPQMLVTKRKTKFHVVGVNGDDITLEGINPAGYKTENEAWAAITALAVK